MDADRRCEYVIVRSTLACAAAIVVLVCAARIFFAAALDEIAAACGAIAGVVNLMLIARISRLLLRGTRSSLSVFLIVSGKIAAFVVLVLILSMLPSSLLYSFLIGFFSFIPGALVYARRGA